MSDDLLCLAKEDNRKAAEHGVDLNPYSTDGSRNLWQIRFDGRPNPENNAIGSFNWRAWERGRLARVICDSKIIPLEIPALFIPLKSEFFDAFASGEKTTEFRQYGPRWNEKTCPIGRRVTLSKGYGIRHRMTGLVVGFEASEEPTKSEAWRKCYGDKPGALAACIRIRLDKPGGGNGAN